MINSSFKVNLRRGVMKGETVETCMYNHLLV